MDQHAPGDPARASATGSGPVKLVTIAAIIAASPQSRWQPPVLGWAAITGEVHAFALILFLIIFAWTPPHFWALAIYRREEYAGVGLPMLPVTHGVKFTRWQILFYTIALQMFGNIKMKTNNLAHTMLPE